MDRQFLLIGHPCFSHMLFESQATKQRQCFFAFFGDLLFFRDFSKGFWIHHLREKKERGSEALRAAAPLSWASQKMVDLEEFLKKSPKNKNSSKIAKKVCLCLVAWLLTHVFLWMDLKFLLTELELFERNNSCAGGGEAAAPAYAVSQKTKIDWTKTRSN